MPTSELVSYYSSRHNQHVVLFHQKMDFGARGKDRFSSCVGVIHQDCVTSDIYRVTDDGAKKFQTPDASRKFRLCLRTAILRTRDAHVLWSEDDGSVTTYFRIHGDLNVSTGVKNF